MTIRVPQLGWFAGLAGAAALAAGGQASPRRPVIVLARHLPAVVRAGQDVIVTGRVQPASSLPACRRSCAASEDLLEGRLGAGRRWETLAAAPATRGTSAFALRWRVPRNLGFDSLLIRVALRAAGNTIAATPVRRALIGPASAPCRPAHRAATAPPGKGWIVGGVYLSGGPAPGVYECDSRAYTVTARNPAGRVVARQRVLARHGYAFILAAGRYTPALRLLPGQRARQTRPRDTGRHGL